MKTETICGERVIIKNEVIAFYASEMKHIESEYKSGKNVNLILASVIEISVSVGEQIQSIPYDQREDTWTALLRLVTPRWWQTDPVWREVLTVSEKLLNRSRLSS